MPLVVSTRRWKAKVVMMEAVGLMMTTGSSVALEKSMMTKKRSGARDLPQGTNHPMEPNHLEAHLKGLEGISHTQRRAKPSIIMEQLPQSLIKLKIHSFKTCNNKLFGLLAKVAAVSLEEMLLELFLSHLLPLKIEVPLRILNLRGLNTTIESY